MQAFYKETLSYITFFNKIEDTEAGFWASRFKYNKNNSIIEVKEKVFISNKDFDSFKRRYKFIPGSDYLTAKLLLLGDNNAILLSK